jgi:hypothetical protein
VSCPRGAALLVLLATLAGCGDLPRPFAVSADHPRRLTQPPPARLAVAPPTNALLPDDAAAVFSTDVADALLDHEVPAVIGPARVGDWRLVLSADLRGETVVPAYTVENPKGEPKGSIQGHPVDAATWSNAGDAVLKQVASADAGTIASLLTSIEAARQRSDPNSLLNRPAKLFVKGVTGAPGDGDHSLARNLSQELPKLGEVVTEDPDQADFTVRAEVRTAQGKNGTTRVEIQWIVTDAAGRERGRIIQLNEVPPEAVADLWGDVAAAAAHEAAGGVREVVNQQTRVYEKAAAPAGGPSAPPAGGPTATKPGETAVTQP